jgi:nicotinamide mononucleotide (NMN) deamidase PncC
MYRHCSDEGFNDYVKELLLFHKVVSVQARNDQDAELVLDNGTVLEVYGNVGCGGCENGWYYLTALNKCDNAITNVEGASDILKFSAVTYSNEYKIKMGVDSDVIDKYSVYSKECSDEMSKNISLFTNSDFGVGITGKLNRVDINNPYGEDNLVFISIYDKENNKFYNEIVEATLGSRSDNKELVINKVISMMMEIIK